jgi:hypothetical protein
MIFKLILISATISSSLSYAAPKRVTRPDPETMTVTGERLNPNFKEGSLNPFIPTEISLGGGSTLPPGEVNANSKKKAKDKKAESEAATSNFWVTLTNALDIASFQAWLTDSLVKVADASKPSLKRTSTKVIHINDKENNVETTIIECTELAINSNNSDTCAKIWIRPGPNNLKLVELTNLVYDFSNKRLIYTTDDTLTFYVNDFNELYTTLKESDAE